MGSRPDQDRTERDQRERIKALGERLSAVVDETERRHELLLQSLTETFNPGDAAPAESEQGSPTTAPSLPQLRSRVEREVSATRDRLAAQSQDAAEELQRLEVGLHEVEDDRLALQLEAERLGSRLAAATEKLDQALRDLSERADQLGAVHRAHEEGRARDEGEIRKLGAANQAAARRTEALEDRISEVQEDLARATAREAQLTDQLKATGERLAAARQEAEGPGTPVVKPDPRPEPDAVPSEAIRELVRTQQRLAHGVDELDRLRSGQLFRLVSGGWRLRRGLIVALAGATVLVVGGTLLLGGGGWWLAIALAPLALLGLAVALVAHDRHSTSHALRTRTRRPHRSRARPAAAWMLSARVRDAPAPWTPTPDTVPAEGPGARGRGAAGTGITAASQDEAPTSDPNPPEPAAARLAEPQTPPVEAVLTSKVSRAAAENAAALGFPQASIEEAASWLGESQALDLSRLRVGLIAPSEVRERLGPEVTALDLEPRHWQEQVADAPADLILVAPGRRDRRTDLDGWVQEPLAAIFGWCKERDIAIVFWDAAGSVPAPVWRSSMDSFERVFTGEPSRIGGYRAKGASEPTALPPATQPRLVTPTPGTERSDGPCLTLLEVPRAKGRWTAAIAAAVEATRRCGLTIHATTAVPSAARRSHVKVVNHDDRASAVQAAMGHPLAVDVNVAGASSTAIAATALELAVAGVPLVSAESPILEQLLGEHVLIAEAPGALAAAIEHLLADGGDTADRAHAARLHVLANHTHRQRLQLIAGSVGFRVSSGAREAITLLVPSDQCPDPRAMLALADTAQRQTEPPLEVLLQRHPAAEEGFPRMEQALPGIRVRVADVDPGTKSEVLGQLAARATAPWVTAYEGGRDYPPHHLEALSAAVRLADRDLTDGAQLLPRNTVVHEGWPDGSD